MKIFQNNKLFKKLIIVLLCMLLISFCVPNIVRAADEGIGGKLLDPILSMFVGLGDGAISLLQKLVLQIDGSMIEVITSTSTIAKVLGVIVAAVVIVGGIAALVALPGATLAFTTVLTVMQGAVVAGIVTFCVSDYMANAALPEDFVLPQIKLSPYEIFANEVPLFDVDFFNPMDDQVRTEIIKPAETKDVEVELDYTVETEEDKKYAVFTYAEHDFKVDITDASSVSIYDLDENQTIGKDVFAYFQENGELEPNPSGVGESVTKYKINTEKNKYGIKLYYDSISKKTAYAYYEEKTIAAETEDVVLQSTAKQLQSIISKWYTILRDLAIVALLSILVYVGIKIIVSSTASDKAKYKQWLIDWIVAICLLFTMHYIMSFSNILAKKLINLIDATDVVENLDNTGATGTPSSNGVVSSKGPQVFSIDDSDKVSKAKEVLVTNRDGEEFSGLFVTENGKEVLKWPTSNFMEQARMLLQYEDSDSSVKNYAYASIGYKIIYIILVLYTFVFAFTYLKRVIYMAFLTLIAPLVALTYPIDKMNDGKAQAFNMWFKEYIFNLLIQPLHLILYMVLVGSALDFASQNLFYVVIALGFMTQGEKLLRKFFGFEKANTPGFLGGPAGAAIMMSGVNKLLGRPPRGVKSSKESAKGSDGDSIASNDSGKIKFKDKLENASSIYGEKGLVNNSNTGVKVSNAMADNKQSLITDNLGVNNNANSKLGASNNLGVNNNDSKLDSATKLRSINGKNTAINSNNAKPKLKNRLKSGARNMLANKGNRIVLKSKNKQPIRSLARGVAGAAGAATAMTAAGLVGITSGDPSKTIQYMTGAAIGGYKFTKGIGDSAVNITENSKADIEAFKEGAYSEDEYKEKQIQKNIEAARKDVKLQRELAQRAGGVENAQEAMDTVGEDCVRYGLSDAKEIDTVYELNKNGYEVDDALKYVKAVKSYGKDTTELGHKDREDFVSTIRDRVRKQMPNGKEEDIERNVNRVVGEFDNTSKILFKK